MENNNSCHELYNEIKDKEPSVCDLQCPFSSPPKFCYTFKTPLIFLKTFEKFCKEKNKYKIVLVTESPHNFPGCPITNCPVKCMKNHGSFNRRSYCEFWAEDEKEFVKEHLLAYGLKRFFKYNFKNSIDFASMPSDIFDFIFYTFLPIFKKGNKENWGDTFTKKIYWTHVAKRSLKKLKEELNKAKKTKDEKAKKKAEKQFNNAIAQCILLLKEELEAIKPNLIIVATDYFWEKFGKDGYKKYTTIENLQEYWINNHTGFLRINLITDLFQNSASCPYVAVFPNPSPRNPHKVKFYKKKYVPKLIEKIHTEIKNNYNNLP